MLMMEAYAMQKDLGGHRQVVRSIRRRLRKNPQGLTSDYVDDLAITMSEALTVRDTLAAHPDWDDEQIAEAIDWLD